MENFVGRTEERKILESALSSPEAELVAVYGRRRIGKTFLIRSVYRKQLFFEFSGLHGASMKDQLLNFSYALKKSMSSPVDLAVPGSWIVAFNSLTSYLEPIVKKKKVAIFFDEFPWIHTQRSNFLRSFEHFWNNWASRHKNLTVVICGSAASWMIRNIVNNKGGLHNRVTIKIALQPFTLSETEAYLKSRRVRLDRYQLLQLYMVMGGVPHYLKSVKQGESAAQAIDRSFFSKDGMLRTEFRNLYASLFENASHHETIIRMLAAKGKGLTRNEIIIKAGISSGGTATQVLSELEESGFVSSYVPFGKTSKDMVYRLADEYSMFYLRFVEKRRAAGHGTWLRVCETPAWKSWSGYAFESLCLKHLLNIINALGIGSIQTEASVWRYVPRSGEKEKGAQIDLLLDRRDHCIHLCEMKFHNSPFEITNSYARELQQKQQVFKKRTGTSKTIFITLISTFGVCKNKHYKHLVHNDVAIPALFS